MFKKLIVFAFFVISFTLFFLVCNKEDRMNNVKFEKMEEHGRLKIGRASIGMFDKYKILGVYANYDGLILKGEDPVSEISFNKWIDDRWNTIKKENKKMNIDVPPSIYRKPNLAIFKYNYKKTEVPGYSFSSFEGEGAIFLNNKVLFIAPKGGFEAYEKILKIINNIVEVGDSRDKGFCVDFYCINSPVSKNERAGVNVEMKSYSGVVLSVDIGTYTSEQNKYMSQREDRNFSSIEDNLDEKVDVGSVYYIENNKRKVNNIEGEENVWGTSISMGGEYYNVIRAQWYHPGISNDLNDPEIDISLIYEFRTDKKPSRKGWFDNNTMKETGFTPEKFMSIWESTLASFKRSR